MIEIKSSNTIVIKALNALSNNDIDPQIEKAFNNAAKKALQEVEKGLVDLTRATSFSSDVYESKSREFKLFCGSLLSELNTVRGLIRYLS